MARKASGTKSSSAEPREASAAKSVTPAATTTVRGTPIPRINQPVRREITHDQISKRAFEIWRCRGGSQMENWLQAERELRGI